MNFDFQIHFKLMNFDIWNFACWKSWKEMLWSYYSYRRTIRKINSLWPSDSKWWNRPGSTLTLTLIIRSIITWYFNTHNVTKTSRGYRSDLKHTKDLTNKLNLLTLWVFFFWKKNDSVIKSFHCTDDNDYIWELPSTCVSVTKELDGIRKLP